MKTQGTAGSRGGFTLVEIMVVVGIIAVVSGIAAANIVASMPMRRLEQSQFQLLSDLRSARMESVTRSVPVTVTFNNSARSYTIWVDRDSDNVVDSGESTTSTLAEMVGGTMSAYPTSGKFMPNGTFQSSYLYAYVYLYSSAGYKYIYVFPSGQVDMYN